MIVNRIRPASRHSLTHLLTNTATDRKPNGRRLTKIAVSNGVFHAKNWQGSQNRIGGDWRLARRLRLRAREAAFAAGRRDCVQRFVRGRNRRNDAAPAAASKPTIVTPTDSHTGDTAADGSHSRWSNGARSAEASDARNDEPRDVKNPFAATSANLAPPTRGSIFTRNQSASDAPQPLPESARRQALRDDAGGDSRAATIQASDNAPSASASDQVRRSGRVRSLRELAVRKATKTKSLATRRRPTTAEPIAARRKTHFSAAAIRIRLPPIHLAAMQPAPHHRPIHSIVGRPMARQAQMPLIARPMTRLRDRIHSIVVPPTPGHRPMRRPQVGRRGDRRSAGG